MIVISSGLVLGQSQDAGPDHPVVGWQNRVTTSSVTADTEDADYPAVNLANPSTALRWKAGDTTEQYITVATGSAEDIDYLAVARHNFGSAAIAVSVEGRDETEGDPPFVELAGPVIPPDDAPLLFRFAPQPLAEIRLKMASGGAPATAAVLYVGKLLVLQRKIYVGHTPMKFGRETRVTNGRSESGQFLGRIVLGESVETGIDLQNLTPAWYRANMEPFLQAARTRPFFFAWRPGKYPYETGYAWLTNAPKPSNQRSNGMMQVALQMGGVSV